MNIEPRRIAMVAACPFPANHGTPGAIRELSLALDRLGHEVHLVTYPIGEDLTVEGLNMHRVSSGGISKTQKITIGPSYGRLVYDALLVPKLIEVIKRHRIDVIHAHNYEAAIAGAMAKWATGVPLVYNGINSMADELPSYDFFQSASLARWLGKVLDRFVPSAGDAMIVLSDELRTYLESLGLPKEKLVVIPPGVTAQDFEGGDASLVRKRHGLAEDVPIVMYTGALEAFQGVDCLVRAMVRVIEHHANAALMIVNNIPNEPMRKRLVRIARQLGIEKNMIIVESVPLSELPHYLAASDVAVVPRLACPGFPIKLLNYMAAGRAIVSFEGSAKCLCHGYNGYVCKNGDEVDMAEGIRLLLDDPKLRATLGARARQSLDGIYDWETLARATSVIYEQVIHAKKPLDLGALATHLKANYKPRFVPGGRDNPDGFLQSGPVEYDVFQSVERVA
ncbi:MAG TPA: glycosyltransferase family 4 protein [Polyangiaceae bacterium]|nr:glycosyltransferase family 4 protein [Polyangiaceae bacterium]